MFKLTLKFSTMKKTLLKLKTCAKTSYSIARKQNAWRKRFPSKLSFQCSALSVTQSGLCLSKNIKKSPPLRSTWSLSKANLLPIRRWNRLPKSTTRSTPTSTTSRSSPQLENSCCKYPAKLKSLRVRSNLECQYSKFWRTLVSNSQTQKTGTDNGNFTVHRTILTQSWKIRRTVLKKRNLKCSTRWTRSK